MSNYENNDILKEVGTDYSCISSNCLTFYEQSLYIAERTEAAFNELFENIGINELAVYESTGETIIYEGSKLQDFKNNVIKVFQSIWAKIKGMYDKVTEYFDKKRKAFLSEVHDLYLDNWKECLNLIPEKGLGKVHDASDNTKDFEQEFLSNALDVQDEINNTLDKLLKSSSEDLASDIKDAKSNIEEKIVSTISGASASTLSDAKKELREKLLGKEVTADKAWVGAHIFEAIDFVMKSGVKKGLQNMYKNEKKNIDKTISELKKIKDESMPVATAKISLFKNVITVLNACHSVNLDCYKRRFNEYSMIILRMGRITHKVKSNNKKSTNTNESVDFESSTYQIDLIESAFNW